MAYYLLCVIGLHVKVTLVDLETSLFKFLLKY
jgi:hypothetical protein